MAQINIDTPKKVVIIIDEETNTVNVTLDDDDFLKITSPHEFYVWHVRPRRYTSYTNPPKV